MKNKANNKAINGNKTVINIPKKNVLKKLCIFLFYIFISSFQDEEDYIDYSDTYWSNIQHY